MLLFFKLKCPEPTVYLLCILCDRHNLTENPSCHLSCYLKSPLNYVSMKKLRLHLNFKYLNSVQIHVLNYRVKTNACTRDKLISCLFVVVYYGLRQAEFRLAAQHGAAGALVTSMAFLERCLGAWRQFLARWGGRGGQNKGLQSSHFCLKNIYLQEAKKNESKEKKM